jgi:mono/diheme cytochrome c family protein
MKKTMLALTGLLAAALPLAAAAKVDFAKDIQPILEKNCVSCHGAEKQKGKLRLDSKEATLKGGSSGDPAVVPGKPGESDFLRRVLLPKGDDDVMPPEGELLTKAQQDLIKAWIEQGAQWPDGLVIKSGEGKPKSAGPQLAPVKPTAAELKMFAELEKLSQPVRPIAMDSEWRYGNFRGLDAATAAKVLPLLKDLKTLTDLNLAGAKITDAQLASLATTPNLTRLHLENTPVTDAGLAHLKGLKNLVYLNLFNTAVTDKGLEHLRGLTSLQKLYVFETKVTDAGIAALKKALPNAEIVQGWKLEDLAKAEPKQDEAKKEEPKKAEAKKEEPKKADAKKKEKKKD